MRSFVVASYVLALLQVGLAVPLQPKVSTLAVPGRGRAVPTIASLFTDLQQCNREATSATDDEARLVALSCFEAVTRNILLASSGDVTDAGNLNSGTDLGGSCTCGNTASIGNSATQNTVAPNALGGGAAAGNPRPLAAVPLSNSVTNPPANSQANSVTNPPANSQANTRVTTPGAAPANSPADTRISTPAAVLAISQANTRISTPATAPANSQADTRISTPAAVLAISQANTRISTPATAPANSPADTRISTPADPANSQSDTRVTSAANSGSNNPAANSGSDTHVATNGAVANSQSNTLVTPQSNTKTPGVQTLNVPTTNAPDVQTPRVPTDSSSSRLGNPVNAAGLPGLISTGSGANPPARVSSTGGSTTDTNSPETPKDRVASGGTVNAQNESTAARKTPLSVVSNPPSLSVPSGSGKNMEDDC